MQAGCIKVILKSLFPWAPATITLFGGLAILIKIRDKQNANKQETNDRLGKKLNILSFKSNHSFGRRKKNARHIGAFATRILPKAFKL